MVSSNRVRSSVLETTTSAPPCVFCTVATMNARPRRRAVIRPVTLSTASTAVSLLAHLISVEQGIDDGIEDEVRQPRRRRLQTAAGIREHSAQPRDHAQQSHKSEAQ